MSSLHTDMPVLIYQDAGDCITEVRLDGETVWLTQKQMGKLFDTTSDNIGIT